MHIDRNAIKQAAKQNMRESRPSPLKVTLLFLLLTTVVSLAVDFVIANPAAGIYQALYTAVTHGSLLEIFEAWFYSGGSTGTMLVVFLNILMFLYGTVMSFGYYFYTVRRTDGEETHGGDLLSGFSQVGRIILMRLVVMGFTFVWVMAACFPAMMLGMVATTVIILTLGEGVVAIAISVCVVYFFLIVAAFFANYLATRYLLAPFILADDPGVSGIEAVRRSRALMRNRLGEGFKLQLSFLGWGALRFLIMLAVAVAVFCISSAAYGVSLNPTVLLVGAYVLAIAGTLVLLPFDMWYVPYNSGTFAQYYRAITPKSAPVQSWQDAERPEPF